jgi:hypothetical protein
MLSQTCARRELAPFVAPGAASLPVRRGVPISRNVAGTAERIPFGGYARLVGAPHYAPSLRSVAGLLLALALQSRLREPSPPSLRVQRGASHHRRASIRKTDAYGGIARERAHRAQLGIVVSARVNSSARRGIRGCRAKPTAAHLQISSGRRGVSSEGHPQQEPAVWARQRAPTAGVRGHCPAEDIPRRPHATDCKKAGARSRGDLPVACRGLG